MEKILKIIASSLLLGTIIAGSSYFYANDFYKKMVMEDGFMENVTALTLLAISILLTIRLVKKNEKSSAWIVFNVLMIIGSFFGFGEEISWGQRIFSFGTGDFFSAHNLQNETNLHNLEFNNIKVNKIIFSYIFSAVFGFYFIFSKFLYKKNHFFKSIVDKYGVPIPDYRHTIYMLVVTALIFIVPDLRIWELWEAAFVLLLLLVFLTPFNSSEKLLPKKNYIS